MTKVGKPMPAVNKAVINVVNLLQEAEASGPQKNNFRKTQRVVTWDSMQAMFKRNDITGDVKKATEQAFITLVGREISGRVDKSNLGKYYIKVDASSWRSLEKTLKGFFKTHNKTEIRTLDPKEEKKLGETAKAIAKGFEKINNVDFKNIQGNKDQSKMVGHIMDVLFSRVGVADEGRVTRDEIREYFKTAAGKKHSTAFKNATYKTFEYLRQSMRHEGWGWNTNNPPRDSMCIDEGERAFGKMMGLKPGGETYEAIAKAVKADS